MRLAAAGAVAATFALALLGILATSGTASAGAIACTPGAFTYTESVAAAPSGSFFVAAHNSIARNAGAEFKLFASEAAANTTARFVHCDGSTGQTIAFEITQGGVLYAATNRAVDGILVHFEAVPAGGPTLAQTWTWAQNGDGTLTFKNVKSSRFLRVPNKGAAQYGPVVAGQSVTNWTQGPPTPVL
jgi:hypothetical protein